MPEQRTVTLDKWAYNAICAILRRDAYDKINQYEKERSMRKNYDDNRIEGYRIEMDYALMLYKEFTGEDLPDEVTAMVGCLA